MSARSVLKKARELFDTTFLNSACCKNLFLEYAGMLQASISSGLSELQKRLVVKWGLLLSKFPESEMALEMSAKPLFCNGHQIIEI